MSNAEQLKKLEERINELQELTCRSFDPKEVMTTLIPDDERTLKYIAWNVEDKIAIVESVDGGVGGLVLKLNHKNFEDCVYITLSFLDFFNVYFVGRDLKVLHRIEDIPADMLFDVINTQLDNVVKMNIDFSLN
jgi:hypothetical protein